MPHTSADCGFRVEGYLSPNSLQGGHAQIISPFSLWFSALGVYWAGDNLAEEHMMIVHETPGLIHPVRLIQDAFDSFTVQAGHQNFRNLNYKQAEQKYGEVILYALAWDGKLNMNTQ